MYCLKKNNSKTNKNTKHTWRKKAVSLFSCTGDAAYLTCSSSERFLGRWSSDILATIAVLSAFRVPIQSWRFEPYKKILWQHHMQDKGEAFIAFSAQLHNWPLWNTSGSQGRGCMPAGLQGETRSAYIARKGNGNVAYEKATGTHRCELSVLVSKYNYFRSILIYVTWKDLVLVWRVMLSNDEPIDNPALCYESWAN